MLPQLVKEALTIDERIADVLNIESEQINNRLHVTMDVITFDYDRLNIERNWQVS